MDVSHRGPWGRDWVQRGDRRVKMGLPHPQPPPYGLLTGWAPGSCALEQVESRGLGWRPQAPPHHPRTPPFGACWEPAKRSGEDRSPAWDPEKGRERGLRDGRGGPRGSLARSSSESWGCGVGRGSGGGLTEAGAGEWRRVSSRGRWSRPDPTRRCHLSLTFSLTQQQESDSGK